MNLKITQAHIDEGARFHPEKDAVALALMDAHKGDGVTVWQAMKTCTVRKDNKVVARYRLSPEAFEFAFAFDAGEEVKPCTVRLVEADARTRSLNKR